MSGYRRWYPSFWDSRMRESFADDHRLVEVWLWLVTSESSSSIGIFRPNMRKLATETYLGSAADAIQAVKRIAELHCDKLRFDALSGYVWVVNAAQRQHGNLSTKDNRLKSGELKAEFVDAMKSPFWGEFLAAYFRLFEVMLSALGVDPYEALGKPLASPSVALREDTKALPEPLRESDQALAKDVRIPALPCPALPTPPSRAVTHAHTNPSQAELAQGASAAWLEDTLEERAKTIMSSSIAEIPVGMEDHIAELKATAQAVASEYMRQCPGVVKSRNLLLGIARAVTALADDSELGCEGAKRQLFLMLEWFKRGNARRWQYPDTQSGKDWFGDAIEVFGGMAGMVSASGVPRDTANVVQANLTQAIAWKADEDARNAPVVHWREEDHPVPPSDPNDKRTLAEMYADFLAAKEREAAEKRAQQVVQ